MKHEEFRLGESFWTPSGEWRCTDVGRRTIVAIQLETNLEPSWFKGPPYAVPEVVFDEYDFAVCYPSEEAMLADRAAQEAFKASAGKLRKRVRPRKGPPRHIQAP